MGRNGTFVPNVGAERLARCFLPDLSHWCYTWSKLASQREPNAKCWPRSGTDTVTYYSSNKAPTSQCQWWWFFFIGINRVSTVTDPKLRNERERDRKTVTFNSTDTEVAIDTIVHCPSGVSPRGDSAVQTYMYMPVTANQRMLILDTISRLLQSSLDVSIHFWVFLRHVFVNWCAAVLLAVHLCSLIEYMYLNSTL